MRQEQGSPRADPITPPDYQAAVLEKLDALIALVRELVANQRGTFPQAP